MSEALVSVIVPCYNHESYVQECIQSIVDQDYKNIELIIIDDGSSDGSFIKIEEMLSICQKRFTRFEFRSRANLGLCATLNEAIKWCQGKYFSVLASDDIILPHKTRVLVEHMHKNPNCVAAFGSVTLIDDKGVDKGSRISSSKYKFEDIFLLKAKLPAPASMVDLQSIRNVGGYDEDVKIEDWDMWLRLSMSGEKSLEVLSCALAKYRMHETNTMKNHELIHEGLLSIAQKYRLHPLYERVSCVLKCIRLRDLSVFRKREAVYILCDLFLNFNSYRDIRFYQGILYLLFKW